MSRKPKPCGTTGAYRRHIRNGEKPCGPCAEAWREYFQKRRGTTGTRLKPCGTPAAYQRHLAAGEAPCKPCRDANSKYQTEKYRTRNLNPMNAALPVEAPDAAHQAPCFNAGRYSIWDGLREREKTKDALPRWRQAAEICRTRCQILEFCGRSQEMAGGDGVWAGRVPGGVVS